MRVRGVLDHPRSLVLGQAHLETSRRICWKARIRRLLLVKVVSVRGIQKGRRISVLQVSVFLLATMFSRGFVRFRTWADRSAKRSEANKKSEDREPCHAQNIPLLHSPGTPLSHPFVVHRCTLESPSASSVAFGAAVVVHRRQPPLPFCVGEPTLHDADFSPAVVVPPFALRRLRRRESRLAEPNRTGFAHRTGRGKPDG